MLINLYLKLARKNLLKNKVHTLISMLGLALGLGCSIIIYQFVRYHLSFDSFQPHAKNIYRVVSDLHLDDGSTEYDSGTPLTMVNNLRKASPEIVDASVALTGRSLTVSPNEGAGISKMRMFLEDKDVAFTDRRWFGVFEARWLAGDKNGALDGPECVVITRRIAEKYFGSADVALGKSLKLDNKIAAIIKGVVDDYPTNTDNKIDVFVSLAAFKRLYPDQDSVLRSGWDITNSSTWTYLRLQEQNHPGEIDNLLGKLTKAQMGEMAKYYKFHLEALKDLHFDMRYGGAIQRSMLASLSIVGLLILVIACVNFINLSTAQVGKRAKEIGAMKVFGSRPSDIFWQFIIETTLLTLISAAIGISCAFFFVPVLNTWLNIKLSLIDAGLLGVYACLILFVIFASGFYPSVVLSRFTPLNAIKDKESNRSWVKNWGLMTLVIGQNSVAQLLIVCAVIISFQVRYLKNTDLGFEKKGVVLIPIPADGAKEFAYLSTRLKEVPDIADVCFCYRPPSDDVMRGGQVKFDGQDWTPFPVRSSFGDTGYLKTFGIQVIAGRNISNDDSSREALINMELLHKLGFQDPNRVLGHRLVLGDMNEHTATIVGVVKNFQTRPLNVAIEPDVITPNTESYQYMAMHVGSNDPMRAIEAVGEIWKKIYPSNLFKYQFFDDRILAIYHKEDLLNKLVKVSTAVAIIISCLGLLGLISLTIVHRTKEMAIRKVIGASSSDVASLLMSQLIRLVIAAMVIAFPITWYLMHKWLEDFAYRIEIEWWYFGIAGLSGLLITTGTIGYQVAKAARANSAKSLKGM